MICSTIGIVSVAPAPQETGISTASNPGRAAVTTASPGARPAALEAPSAPVTWSWRPGAGHRHHDARSWAPVRVDDGAFDRASRLAGRQRLFDWLVIGQVVPTNPATSVRGPTHVVRTGKTPVLQPAEARLLLDTIDTSTLRGLRDRALLAVMVYSFARVSAVVGMRVEDYYQQGKRWWLRLQEKGGKHHALPVHHKAEAYLDAYLDAAGIAAEKDAPLWRSMPRAGGMGARRMSRVDVFRMIKRRIKTVGLGEANCHTFRATGITAYLLNGGTLERAQAIAGHESPRTTKLYDRTADEVTIYNTAHILTPIVRRTGGRCPGMTHFDDDRTSRQQPERPSGQSPAGLTGRGLLAGWKALRFRAPAWTGRSRSLLPQAPRVPAHASATRAGAFPSATTMLAFASASAGASISNRPTGSDRPNSVRISRSMSSRIK